MPRFHRRSLFRAAATAAALLIASPALAGPAAGGTTALTDEGTEWVAAQLAGMTLEEKVGQLFVVQVYGADAHTVTAAQRASNQAAYGVDTPAQVVEKYHLGGVIYFAWAGNVTNPEQIARLSNDLQRTATADGGPPLIVSTDQETGIVARMPAPATQFPGAQALAAAGSTNAAREAARITARELRAVGINQNFAPVADVNVNAENPVIGVRSFSSDPAMAAEYVAAQVAGYQLGEGVAAAAKHFPGHGDTTTDSHYGVPEIDHTRQEWETIDAPPFRAAIDAGIDVIMTAHIVVDSLDPTGVPATLSEPIITGLLRDELGYDGVVITDALNMEGVRQGFGPARVPVLALRAGVDQLLVPKDGDMDVMYQAVLQAVRDGEISEQRLDESVERILRLKWDRGITEDEQVDVERVARTVGNRAHQIAAERITDPTVTALRNTGADGAAILPVAPTSSVNVVTTNTAAGNDLAAALRERGATAAVQAVGTRPSDAAIAAAVQAAPSHDLTVVITSNAWDIAATDPEGRQRRLVAELAATGHAVVAVAARNAYDVAYLPETAGFLAAYSSTTVSMRSVAKVITGEFSPAGRLPVVVPAADGSVLYPIGHGLTW
ncbi:glycoside hydrolase family 3 protein [Jiangella rhizosphaerae]|uniref:beta-N-acetylhexosaminidase n=1 Tax=Jiangella rhizosphaerae TaxID=2293569 RepID=A0A418KWD2_9ACTN|nr:glycoside hydrolase family 3 protein [Jiangella rhizosphaerae]RIQ34089.1 glycoside hydrolase family 3 protein [Jiangella rhizosphaerae]